jgi:hypothetical protein
VERSSEARGRRLQFLKFLRGVERDRCESAPHGRGRPHSLAHARRAVVSWPAPRPVMLWSAGDPWRGRRRRGAAASNSSNFSAASKETAVNPPRMDADGPTASPTRDEPSSAGQRPVRGCCGVLGTRGEVVGGAGNGGVSPHSVGSVDKKTRRISKTLATHHGAWADVGHNPLGTILCTSASGVPYNVDRPEAQEGGKASRQHAGGAAARQNPESSGNCYKETTAVSSERREAGYPSAAEGGQVACCRRRRTQAVGRDARTGGDPGLALARQQ